MTKSIFRRKSKQVANSSDHNASDSDSECSSVDKDIYAKVQGRLTPHKKKYKSGHHSDSSPPPPLQMSIIEVFFYWILVTLAYGS